MAVLPMIVKLIVSLILFQKIILNVTVFAAEDNSLFRSGYFITRENKQLAGHVVKQFESPSFMSCSQSCLRNSWCTSTNFRESSKEENKGTCELNKNEIAPIDEDAHLIDKPGVTFSMFLKGCLMTGCHNGGSCLFDKKKETFTCSCELPWSGDECEVKKGHTEYVFTTLDARGETGPSRTSGYVGTTLEGQVTLNNGIQIWTVSMTGSYVIEAAAGSGANGTRQSSLALSWRLGGLGAKMRGTFQLKQGTQLKILVGQEGAVSSNFVDRPGGGGGGSFVTLSDNTPLVIAGGGGGGATPRDQFTDGDPGQVTGNGTQCGGTGGTGGQFCNADTGNAGSSFFAVGGAGLSGDGRGWVGFGTAPLSFINGGTGGTCLASQGSFGGGAFALILGGGGGGYSGGGVTGTLTKGTAGGGGSYNNGTNQYNMAGVNKGDGKVIITLKT